MSSDENAKTLTDSQFEIMLGKVGPGKTVFGRYRLLRELGRGGMGVVWLAQDTRVDVQVALKFLPDAVARDSESVEELKGELRRGLSLTHPSIVRVYSFEQDETGAAIAMEYVDGPTLSSLKIKQAYSCFDCDELFPYVEQLCAALDYAHNEARIVHRDLKPRNLMLNSKGRLKIADFGIASSIAETLSRSSLRKDGSGTPSYMSPQQAFGENPSPSDDIYSLGATLYELLTGRAPFYQGNILAQVQQRVAPPMSERREVLKVTGREPIPECWEKTIAACLAKHAEDRPQRAAEVLEYLSGKRPAPKVITTRESPIIPIVTLDERTFASPKGKPTKHKPIGDHEETVYGPSYHDTVQPTEFVPPSRGHRGLSWLAIVAALAAGYGIWWSQQRHDDQESRRLAAETTPVPEVTSPELPTAATPEPTLPPESVKPAELSDADRERIIAGELPRPDAPWENTMQMRFLPVPGLVGTMAMHETKVGDYIEFATDTKRPMMPTKIMQGDEHPVVNVKWNDAVAFCDWLTQKERKEGKLGSLQRYRLPTDLEWSAAAGLPKEEGATPKDRNGKTPGSYGWPNVEVPPQGAGNFASEGDSESEDNVIHGYRDGYSHTAPVGKFSPNVLGIHDMAGNAAEWVEDWFDESKVERTIRGGAWVHLAEHELLTSFRWHLKPDDAEEYIGFRILLDCGPMPQNLPVPMGRAVPADPPPIGQLPKVATPVPVKTR